MYSFLFSFLIGIVFLVPNTLLAAELSQNTLTPEIQYKVAKGYSSKFCNAIGMGVSKESAIKLSIKENTKAVFNPSLWFDLALRGEDEINEINKESLAFTISENIINDCGSVIGLTGRKGIDEFLSYFYPLFISES